MRNSEFLNSFFYQHMTKLYLSNPWSIERKRSDKSNEKTSRAIRSWFTSHTYHSSWEVGTIYQTATAVRKTLYNYYTICFFVSCRRGSALILSEPLVLELGEVKNLGSCLVLSRAWGSSLTRSSTLELIAVYQEQITTKKYVRRFTMFLP